MEKKKKVLIVPWGDCQNIALGALSSKFPSSNSFQLGCYNSWYDKAESGVSIKLKKKKENLISKFRVTSIIHNLRNTFINIYIYIYLSIQLIPTTTTTTTTIYTITYIFNSMIKDDEKQLAISRLGGQGDWEMVKVLLQNSLVPCMYLYLHMCAGRSTYIYFGDGEKE